MFRLGPRVALGLAFAISPGCGGDAGGDAEPPAHIDNPTGESQLTTVRLSAQAVSRIGIMTAQVERKVVASRRSFGGEIMSPAGTAVALRAPRAATVLPPAGGRFPIPGQSVAAGQELFRLATLPADMGRAAEEAASAQARVENARAKAERARRLLGEGIASRSEVEDAEAELQSATAAASAAGSRLELLQSGHSGGAIGSLSAIALRAPRSGVVLAVHVAPGQTVPDGGALAELVEVDRLWVRVPVFGGDRDLIARAPAVVRADVTSLGSVEAQPIDGPPSADPGASSVDLYYRLGNAGGRFRPGERVSVSVPLITSAEGLVVPWASVLIDINGGTWVYVVTGENAFTRTRVEVAEVVDGSAVLRRGPAEGATVVTVGAAELFSTEFGAGH